MLLQQNNRRHWRENGAAQPGAPGRGAEVESNERYKTNSYFVKTGPGPWALAPLLFSRLDRLVRARLSVAPALQLFNGPLLVGDVVVVDQNRHDIPFSSV